MTLCIMDLTRHLLKLNSANKKTDEELYKG